MINGIDKVFVVLTSIGPILNQSGRSKRQLKDDTNGSRSN